MGGEAHEATSATAVRPVAARGGQAEGRQAEGRQADAPPRCATHAAPLAGGRPTRGPTDAGARDAGGGSGSGASISASELAISASELAFSTPPVTGACGVRGAAAEPSRAQRRLHEQQQQAAQSLLRALQAHTSSARERLETTCRAANSATGVARQGSEHMEGAAARLRTLTAELRAMRQGTCLESLPPPKFNI